LCKNIEIKVSVIRIEAQAVRKIRISTTGVVAIFRSDRTIPIDVYKFEIARFCIGLNFLSIGIFVVISFCLTLEDTIGL